jgi:hypothetical protein
MKSCGCIMMLVFITWNQISRDGHQWSFSVINDVDVDAGRYAYDVYAKNNSSYPTKSE